MFIKVFNERIEKPVEADFEFQSGQGEHGVDGGPKILGMRRAQRLKQGMPVMKVIVEGAHRDAGFGGNALHARAVYALAGKHSLGGLENAGFSRGLQPDA
jgi:hypothetical protein